VATYLNKKAIEGNWKAVYIGDDKNSIKGHPVNKETHVVMSLVNPYKELRNELRDNNGDQVVEVLLQSNRDLRKDYHVKDFEEGVPNAIVSTDRETEDSWNHLKKILEL
jgi:hypothetical protein